MKTPRIVFAGTPDFSVPALEALIAMDAKPVAVLTQPDRPAGRGRKLKPGPVKQAALEHGIPVHQPVSLVKDDHFEALQSLQPDLMIVVAYGLILPQKVLDWPAMGCWNIHASLLPRWRGAAPIQRAIEAGDRETGVCIMQMEAGLDTGPVFHELRTAIADDETGGSLHDRLATLGGQALTHCLQLSIDQQLPEPVPQDHSQSVYAHKITKAEVELDWLLEAGELERKVRAFNPWPVTWFERNGQRIRVWKAQAINTATNAEPGSILSASADGIDIATGKGILKLLEVQPAGSRRMHAADFINAHHLE